MVASPYILKVDQKQRGDEMTKIEEIKAKLNSVEKLNLGTKMAGKAVFNITLVLSGLDTGKTEEKCIAFLDKNKAWGELEKFVDERVKISNRVKHSFNSLDDLNEFMSNNECGEYWYDADVTDSKYYVYSY